MTTRQEALQALINSIEGCLQAVQDVMQATQTMAIAASLDEVPFTTLHECDDCGGLIAENTIQSDSIPDHPDHTCRCNPWN